MNLTIEQILKESPTIESYGGGKWAFYSANCCWWTSFPEDLGSLPPVRYDETKMRLVPNPGGPRLPCCPHCHSVLLQAPLEDFIKSAQANPAYYGPLGIDIFTMSHERNSKSCFRTWAAYTVFIKPFGKEGA